MPSTSANAASTLAPSTPSFWRDDALPFIEVRAIADGRKVSYGRHAHSTFSIGAVTGGHSSYLNGNTLQHIGAGTVVIINANVVHACNPAADEPWAYRMFYVDVEWLANLQRALGFGAQDGLRPFEPTLTRDPALFAGLNALYDTLTDPRESVLNKERAVTAYFTALIQATHEAVHPAMQPDPTPLAARESNARLARAAEFIDGNYTRALKLDEICAAADLSPSHLIRAFREQYGMTPHAYVVNRRIEFSRAQLRRGHAIADVAAEAGFADQAHLQRAFRQFVAATPGQYRG
ncbi:AraC family transcriptional regulator [Paraburkholderia sp. J94]|uniref:AraC family transcriptional regulator n=1 Tax=Paraburkholderia sp. J94 TaxID=2805441 RepID=UPI002AB053D0|nr:AraC family transcriptional regulator [Paraburkholderia sp. J94]